MRDRITLKAMRFHVRVGVYPHEMELPQPIEIDLTVELRRSRAQIIDYVSLYTATASVFEAGHIGYLEEIAERVASRTLAIEGVSVAHVAVRKPHVPLPGPLAYAEVSITRPDPDSQDEGRASREGAAAGTIASAARPSASKRPSDG
jgi:dihydroneopterin aldolase